MFKWHLFITQIATHLEQYFIQKLRMSHVYHTHYDCHGLLCHEDEAHHMVRSCHHGTIIEMKWIKKGYKETTKGQPKNSI